MTVAGWILLPVAVAVLHPGASADVERSEHPLGRGHLQKFGDGRPHVEIDTVELFPAAADFFERYAKKSRPLVMRRAVEATRAYALWTDDYFMGLNITDDDTVLVETKKKENRTQPSLNMSFKNFVTIYNATDYYMVEPVPEFLRHDVSLPGPLQCQDLINGHLVEHIMWFSSGGTKSVVHTDSVDNIICLYSGKKEFVLIDPHRYKAAAVLDHPEGSYSSVDVDRVDYDTYPAFASVEFHVASLTAGDCLFIPYKWLHQVNSYGRNIAVNVWWDFHKNDEINLSDCNTDFDANLTLYDVDFLGFSSLETSLASVRSNFEDMIRQSPIPMDVTQLKRTGLGPFGDPEFVKKAGAAHNIYVMELFKALDRDRDGYLTPQDLELCTDEDWNVVVKNINYLTAIIKRLSGHEGDANHEHAEFHDHEEL